MVASEIEVEDAASHLMGWMDSLATREEGQLCAHATRQLMELL